MKPSFKKALRFARAALILLCLFALLCGCGPSLGLQRKKKQGKLPSQWEFPQTKWVCRELDFVIYTTDLRRNLMVGTYVEGDTTYRVVASISMYHDTLYLDFYSRTDCFELVSGNTKRTEFYERVYAGEIRAGYTYEKETETIVLDCRSVKPVNGETIPKTLTFERAGTVAETPKTRWVADELDLYLDAFSDVDVYMKGEITLDGEIDPVYAFEIGNGNYYEVYVGNEHKGDYLFEFFDDRIVATRISAVENTITFRPAPIE